MKPLLALVLLFLAACAAPLPQPEDPDALASDFGQPGEVDYHLLMAEIALQRELPALAATEYLNAARLSDDPAVAARATRIASAFGTRAEGLEAARRWVALAPADLHPRRFLVRFHLDAGEVAQAATELGWLRAAADDVERPFLGLLPLATETRARADAHAAMALVADRYPEDASGAYATGFLALRAGDVASALRRAARALELEPDWTEAALLYARAMASDHRAAEALAWLEARPDANSRALRLERAVMLMAIERNAEARELLEQVLAADAADADALRALAYLEYFEGRTDAARDAFMALLATGEHTNDALFYLGGLAEQQGDIEDAARLYSRVDGGEHLLTAQVRLALMMVGMGRPELAINHLELFARRNPEAALELGVARAELLMRLGLPEDALAVYDELLARAPEQAGIYYARGLLHAELGDVDGALADFGRVLEMRPDDASALNALGYTLTDMADRHEEAYPLIRRALELAPDDPAILDSMGWVLFKLDRPAEGLPYVERSWSLQRDPEIAAHLGEMLWRLGRTDEARRIWLEGIVEFPGSQVLLDTMGRLDP